jgi:D-glycero-alpha-D-manno-heptose-7-phosphate kinase
MNYIVKTPCRLSLLGGGTDYEKFIEKSGVSYVLSLTINKYVYTLIKNNNISNYIYNEKYRLNYYNSESTSNIKFIKNKIIKNILLKFDKFNSYYISLFSDIPSGTGLGSSSAFIVGLIRFFNFVKNKKISQKKILKCAIRIERKSINPYTGKQDQAAAVYGGFNFIKFYKKNTLVEKLNNKIQLRNLKNIIHNSILIWSGNQRNSKKILKNQGLNFKKKYKYLKEINDLSKEGYNQVSSKFFTLEKFGKILSRSFNLKRKLSKKITNSKINKIMKILEDNGSYGFKILGAGGGGFVFCLMKKEKIIKFKKKYIKKLKFIDYDYEPKTTSIMSFK